MHRTSSRSASSLALLLSAGSLLAAVGCMAGPTIGGASTPTDGGAAPDSPPGDTDGDTDGDPDAGGPASTDAGQSTTSAYACSGAGIAAYADALVKLARTSCTTDGIGVVKDDNYACMQSPITEANPPHPDASYNIVSTLLAGNTVYPFLECTYFVQSVTAGVCDVPISPTATPWMDYPLACEFINKPAAGYDWINKTGGVVQLGDILLYTSSDGCQNDPGHIMIVVEVKDSTHFRVAEANELTSTGAAATKETGVISNTRIETLSDPYLAPGWFRKTGT